MIANNISLLSIVVVSLSFDNVFVSVSVSVCFLLVPLFFVPLSWFSCFVVHFPYVMCAFPLVVPPLPLQLAMSCFFPLALVRWFLFVPFRVGVSFLCLGTFGD